MIRISHIFPVLYCILNEWFCALITWSCAILLGIIENHHKWCSAESVFGGFLLSMRDFGAIGNTNSQMDIARKISAPFVIRFNWVEAKEVKEVDARNVAVYSKFENLMSVVVVSVQLLNCHEDRFLHLYTEFLKKTNYKIYKMYIQFTGLRMTKSFTIWI